MDSVSKVLLGLGIGAGTYLIGKKFITLGNLGNNLGVQFSGRIHTVMPLVLAVDVILKNPTKASISVRHPFISIFESEADAKSNSALLSSTLQSNTYPLAPDEQLKLAPILFTVPALAALSMAKTAYKTGQLSLWYNINTRVGDLATINKPGTYNFKL